MFWVWPGLLWPVWGLLTPLILGLVAMACLMSLHFIPIPC